MTKLPLIEALALIRDFGLLVNQVAIYGISHKVIQQQAFTFFDTLKQSLTDYGPVELSLLGDKVAVNDSAEGIDLMSARNIKEKMLLHKLPSISLDPMLTQQEFFTFLSYLGTPPVTIQGQGGVEELLKKADIKGISLSHFIYQRVDAKNAKEETAPLSETVPQSETAPQSETVPQAPTKPRKRSVKPARGGQTEALNAPQSQAAATRLVRTNVRRRRANVRTELDALLSEVSLLVSSDDKGEATGESEGVPQKQHVVDTLRSIRDTLRQSTESSKENIADLLDQPYERREAVAGIKKSGRTPYKTQFSRKEFMARLAELTQELAQPLTVTNSVIELLRNGHAGSITEAQTNFLDLALESVDRVNQLIKYMHTLSGEPESYTPDAKIVGETYA